MKEKINKENGIAILIILFLALFLLPIRKIEWGKLKFLEGETVTVVGEAELREKNQIARYTVQIEATNDNKEKAINEVSKKVEVLIKKIKDFGIKEEDLKTQNVSVYQEENIIREDNSQKRKKGEWRVHNSLEIILRDVDKSSDLSSLLNSSEISSIYGPNFFLEESDKNEEKLLEMAMDKAKEKAEILAKISDKKLDGVISVVEGRSQSIYPMKSLEVADFGSGAVPVEAGSSKVSKSITVVFRLK